MHLIEITKTEKINEIFPFIKDKMVIDLVNGTAVSKRLNQANHETNQGFIKRNLSLISGKIQQRQANINDHTIAGLEACQAYVEEISCHIQSHAVAISKLNEKLAHTQNTVGQIANIVANLHEQVRDMNASLDKRINRLEMAERANHQMENLLSAWEAQKFIELSPMGQCFLVLDRLKWGDFGFYINQLNEHDKQEQLDTLANKIIVIQKTLLNKNPNDDLLKTEWLTPTKIGKDQDQIQQALQYQGDWSWENPKTYGMTFTATQIPMLDKQEAQQYENLAPHMIDINRVSKRMLNNVFE